MAQDNIKDFTLTWVLAGLLLTCLLGFAIRFMYVNNPTYGYGSDTDGVFSEVYGNQQTALVELPEDSNLLLNITSNTNPEVSDLGSRDSVATSYSATGTAKNFWTQSRKMISWVFSGTTGALLLGVIGGLIGLLTWYFIVKLIRGGS